MAPGIALIVIGAIGLLLMGGYFVLTVFLFATGASKPPANMPEAERAGYYIGAYGVIILFGLNAFLQILVILSGIAMVTCKTRGVAIAGGIVSVIPCLSSLCFLGIPFGIWALVVLVDPNVKRIFK